MPCNSTRRRTNNSGSWCSVCLKYVGGDSRKGINFHNRTLGKTDSRHYMITAKRQQAARDQRKNAILDNKARQIHQDRNAYFQQVTYEEAQRLAREEEARKFQAYRRCDVRNVPYYIDDGFVNAMLKFMHSPLYGSLDPSWDNLMIYNTNEWDTQRPITVVYFSTHEEFFKSFGSCQMTVKVTRNTQSEEGMPIDHTLRFGGYRQRFIALRYLGSTPPHKAVVNVHAFIYEYHNTLIASNAFSYHCMPPPGYSKYADVFRNGFRNFVNDRSHELVDAYGDGVRFQWRKWIMLPTGNQARVQVQLDGSNHTYEYTSQLIPTAPPASAEGAANVDICEMEEVD